MMKRLSLIDFISLIFLCLAIIFVPLAFSKSVYAVYRLPKTMVIWLTGIPLLFLFAVKSWQQKKVLWPQHWLFWLPSLLVLWLAFTLPFSLQPLISLVGYRNSYLGFITYLASFGLFLGAYNLAQELKSNFKLYFLRLVSLVSFLLNIWAWLQYLGLKYPTSFTQFGGQRVGSLIGNPNNFGGWIALILPLLLAYYFLASKAEKPWPATVLLFSVSGLVLSQSTAALGTALVASLLVLIFMAKPQLTKQARVLILLAVFVMGIVFLLFSLPQEKASVNSRLMLWQAGVKISLAKPFFGVGMDNLRYVTSRYAQPKNVTLSDEKMADMHNVFLDFSSQTGLLGAVLFALFLLGLLFKGLLLPPGQKYFSFGLIGAILSFLLMMQTTPSSPAVLSYFWIVAGLAAYFFLPEKKITVITNQVLLGLVLLASAGLLFLTLFYAVHLWQADYYFDLAMQTNNANESVSLTEKATKAMPYDYYYGTLASLAIQMTEKVDPQFLPIIKLAAEKGLAINNLESNNYAALAYYYLLLGEQKNYQQAIFYFQEALKRDPYNLNALYGLSKAYFLNKQKQKGQKYFKFLQRHLSPQDERLVELKKLAASF